MMNSNSITSKRENCNGINPINPFFIRLQESAGPLQCMVLWLETTSIRSALCLPVIIVASLRLQAQWISKSKAFRHLKKPNFRPIAHLILLSIYCTSDRLSLHGLFDHLKGPPALVTGSPPCTAVSSDLTQLDSPCFMFHVNRSNTFCSSFNWTHYWFIGLLL